jgi:CRISPR-associated endoribonuclease Cas6
MSDFPDLYALVIRLRPERGGPSPDPRGHGAQALFLDLLRQVAPDLAAHLHADAPSKPYTVAVLPARGHARSSNELVELRVAFTQAELFPPVSLALLQQLPGAATLRLGRAVLTLADVLGTPGSHPWAGFSSFAALADAARPAASVTLEFTTPTAFSQGTRADSRQRLGLLPTPETIFGSIARRWNELAPADLRLDPDMVEAAARDTLVSRYALETAQINLGKGPQKGFLGICTYELPPDPSPARTLSLLADAVFYLGVGMKTARGMGLCRRTDDRRPTTAEGG